MDHTIRTHADLLRFIAEDSILTRLLEHVRGRLVGDPGHDLAHALRVALWTLRLGSGAAVEPRHAIAAALLHDIVNLPKDSPERARASDRSADVATALLAELGLAPRDVDDIVQAIRDHSYSTGRVPRSPLGDALQDADRLEALGALGILRTASCGARLGADYFDVDDPWAERRALDDAAHTVDHFFQKLLRLAPTLRTPAGREEARRRSAFMIAFLRQLGSEIGAAPPESSLEVAAANGARAAAD